MLGNLQSGLLQSLFPCPMIGKEISPHSDASILTGDCGSREDQMCTIPSGLAAGRNACQWRNRVLNSICNILNQINQTTAAIMYYYTACMRARLFCCGNGHYFTFQNMAGFSHQFIQQYSSPHQAQLLTLWLWWQDGCHPLFPDVCHPMKLVTLPRHGDRFVDYPNLLSGILGSSARIACAYAETLPEYFTESFISNMEDTATKNDHMKQVETPGRNRLHLLTVN